MWLTEAVLSAFFAGVTAVLAKMGIKEGGSHAVTAVRTVYVAIFAWIIAMCTDGIGSRELPPSAVWGLILSGITTGASWLCYYKALQIGMTAKVAAVDKSSVLLTVTASVILFQEPLSPWGAAGLLFIGAGVISSIDISAFKAENNGRSWLIWAVGSAVFAASTSLLGKAAVASVPSNLGTAIRTAVVMIMAWVVAGVTGEIPSLQKITGRSHLFLFLSGLTTGLSWIFYYSAMKSGPLSVIAPIDKMSIIVTVVCSYFLLGEKPSRSTVVGILLLLCGTLLLLL